MESFSLILKRRLGSPTAGANPLSRGICRTIDQRWCRLCHASSFPYAREVAAKEEALGEFFDTLFPAVPRDPLLPSPSGREYRSVSKRRVFQTRKGVLLGFIDPDERESGGRIAVVQCAIEPAFHGVAFQLVQAALGAKPLAELAEELKYVIVRGSAQRSALILHVHEITHGVIHAANLLSRRVTAKAPIHSIFLYESAGDDRYYLGNPSGAPRRSIRKIYGEQWLSHVVSGRRLFYSPFGFSQVNHALLDPMMERLVDLIAPKPGTTLVDLYCGYGTFGLVLAGSVQRVMGVEASHLSIDLAVRNAERLGAGNAQFLQRDIAEESTARIMRTAGPAATVLLDPPRGGTGEGVIEAIADARPARVVHIFCDIDGITREADRWTRGGYAVERIVPMDMFPGTSAVETALLLRPR